MRLLNHHVRRPVTLGVAVAWMMCASNDCNGKDLIVTPSELDVSLILSGDREGTLVLERPATSKLKLAIDIPKAKRYEIVRYVGEGGEPVIYRISVVDGWFGAAREKKHH